MLLIASGLLLSNEKTSFSRCFLLTLVIVLLIWPSSVLSIGFWFSFTAVGLILLQFIHVDIKLPGKWALFNYQIVQKIATLLVIQLVLSITMLLLSLLFFGELSLISPLANIIAIPLISFMVLPSILVGLVMSSLGWMDYAELIFNIVQSVLSDLSLGLEKLVELNWSWSMPAIHQHLSIIVLMLGIFLWLYLKHWPGKWLIYFLIIPLFVDAEPKLESGEFKLNVFDVGQGLAIWIETQDKNLLVDTGFGTKKGFNYFTSTIYPILKANGVERLDVVVISHGDADHAGGFPALIESDLQLGSIYSSHDLKNSTYEYCADGVSWHFDGIHFKFMTQQNVVGENNQSCVLRLYSKYGSVLLPGDIERESERQLLINHKHELDSNVLIVPHHGSQTSSSKLFIKAVRPELAIFSTGYLNRYGHPAAKVIKRYQTGNIKMLNTACQGQITVSFYKSGISNVSIRQTNQPFWRHQCSTLVN